MADSLVTCLVSQLGTPPPPHTHTYKPPSCCYCPQCTTALMYMTLVSFRKRVKESMFPGSLPPNSEAPGNTRVLPNQQTNLEQLSRPSQMVKTAIANLINYQVRTQLGAEVKVAPPFIELEPADCVYAVDHHFLFYCTYAVGQCCNLISNVIRTNKAS